MAALAGERKQAEQSAERQQQMSIAAMEITSRRELAQFEADMRVQAIKLSQAWELEKMQRMSELDFQQKQKELTLSRDAYLMKKGIANEEYLAYVKEINSRENFKPEEKEAFIQMAYDKKVAGMDVAERVYFPEKYQEKSELSQFTGEGEPVASGKSLTPSAPAITGPTAEFVNRVKAAKMAAPGASDEEINAAIKPQVIADITERRARELGASPNMIGPEDAQRYEQARKMAETEYELQKRATESTLLGQQQKPASFIGEAWEHLIERPAKAWTTGQPIKAWNEYIQKQRAVPSRNYPADTAENEQNRADRARARTRLYKRTVRVVKEYITPKFEYVQPERQAEVTRKAGRKGFYKENGYEGRW